MQIYPENVEQATMLSEEAMKVGFSGGLVVDYPHSTRAKKYYLCLMVGAAQAPPAPRMHEHEKTVASSGREGQRGNKRSKVAAGVDKVRADPLFITGFSGVYVMNCIIIVRYTPMSLRIGAKGSVATSVARLPLAWTR